MLRAHGFAHLRIWPRGVDTALFQPARRDGALRATWLTGQTHPEGKAILLYVGRLSWEKNLHLLAQAYRDMDHTRCYLVIVGGGPARSDLQRALHGLPVTFTGYLSGKALAAAYASADVFAFPSTTETFGQVVLEAMASGLPVVGLLAEGVRDLVTDEQTGLLLAQELMSEEEQVVEYRLRLSRLVHNQQPRERLRQAALAEARTRSWPLAMECLLRGYQEVITAKVKRQGLVA